ncbi:MAG TPA: DUF2461 domain-containing protein [Acidimicrobiales bacterium]|nr:DUF2461 domain-containing protein [Acidimicrobiales bacterium]
MAFRGWPAEAIEFYEGLEADNSKAYWTENKPVYEAAVYGPMSELLAELAGDFGEGKIFRPYRDVRFSKDKAPYKTALGATLAHGGYVQFSAAGLGVGTGMYQMAPDQLARYREAVAADVAGVALERLVKTLAKSDISVTGHDSLKTAPKGYAKDHPRIDLLRHKGLVAWQQWPPAEWLGTARAKKRVVDFLRATRPVNEWLADHVGASTLEAGRWG